MPINSRASIQAGPSAPLKVLIAGVAAFAIADSVAGAVSVSVTVAVEVVLSPGKVQALSWEM